LLQQLPLLCDLGVSTSHLTFWGFSFLNCKIRKSYQLHCRECPPEEINTTNRVLLHTFTMVSMILNIYLALNKYLSDEY
jgi:hypothetical protein